jgi:hypothetical protein
MRLGQKGTTISVYPIGYSVFWMKCFHIFSSDMVSKVGFVGEKEIL